MGCFVGRWEALSRREGGARPERAMAEQFRVATCNLQTGIGTTRGYWHYLLTG